MDFLSWVFEPVEYDQNEPVSVSTFRFPSSKGFYFNYLPEMGLKIYADAV